MWHRLRLSIIGWLLAVPSAHAGMCALCRQALAQSHNRGLIQGFYWSILLIGGVPLIIMAAVGFVIWRHSHSSAFGPRSSRPAR